MSIQPSGDVPDKVQEAEPVGASLPEVVLPAIPSAVSTPVKAPKPDKKKKKKQKKDKGMVGSQRGIETMFRASYRTHMDLSGLADAKANIMISINGIIMSIVLASISPKIDTNVWLLIPTSVLLISCLLSMVYAVLSARPRVSSDVITLEDVRAGKANILFFGHFVTLSKSDYVIGMKELLQNTDALYTNMIKDIYGLGTVLKRKFELLRVSYTVFMFGLVISIAFFISVYIMVAMGYLGATI